MGYISEVNLNGQTHKVGSSLYGTCGTTASTATKVVALADYSTLTVGTTIRVKFSYSNSVANPKLNVNGLGAIPIYKYGTTTPGASSELSWNAGAVVSFTYDGSAWMMNDWNDMSESVANVADGLAILATGNTHAAISRGQFVYVRNHGSAEGFSGNAVLADGLYVAQANINANGALTTSNLTADGSGGLNALKSEVVSLNSKIANGNITVLDTVNGVSCRYVVRSGYCYVHINGTPNTTNNITFTVPKALIGEYLTCGQWAKTENHMQVFVDTNSTVLTVRNHATVSINVNLCYPVA